MDENLGSVWHTWPHSHIWKTSSWERILGSLGTLAWLWLRPTWADSTAETYGQDPTSLWSFHPNNMKRREVLYQHCWMPAEGTHKQAIPKATPLVPTTSVLVQTHITSHLDCYSCLPTACLRTVPGQGFPLSGYWGKDTHSTSTVVICKVHRCSCIMSKPKT